MASARERASAARAALEAGFPSAAVSAAYYAMLYAERAAISEHDRNAKTHRGVWTIFAEVFVATGRFDNALFVAARRIQELREAADYDARDVSTNEAGAIVTDAERFVVTTTEMLEG